MYIYTTKLSDYCRVNDYSNTEMIGESKPYLLSNDEVSSINQLLMNEGQPTLSTNIVTSYYKAKIKGKVFTSVKYTRQKRQNNHTISFSNTTSNGYGNIELFMSAGNVQIVAVKKFITQLGIPHNLPAEIITAQTQNLLFEDYFTCTEECTVYLLLHHIVSKCINLSTNSTKLITFQLNSIETE